MIAAYLLQVLNKKSGSLSVRPWYLFKEWPGFCGLSFWEASCKGMVSMRRVQITRFMAIFTFLFAVCIPSADARLYIDITAPILRSIPIELSPLATTPASFENRELAKRVIKILKNDLEFYGYFKPYYSPVDPSDVVLEYQVAGRLVRSGDKISVELRLHDARTGRMLTGRRYRGTRDPYTLRKMAHRFSELIVEVITGEGGVSLSKIVFVGASANGRSVYLADFDGYGLEKLVSGPSIKLSPRISPDAQRLAYTSYKTGRPALYIRNLKDKSTRVLTRYSGINMSPTWHPDGGRLAVTLSKDGNPDLYLIDLNGKVIRRLTRGRGINCSPSWSPDGRKLVFVSDRYGSPQIFVMDVRAGATQRLTYSGRYNTDPQWSPRGDRIVYVGRSEGLFQIFIISAEGGDPTQLTYSGNNENPSWSPDGRQILFTSDRLGGKSIFVMDANGRRQRRLVTLKGQNALMPFWGPNRFR